MQFLGCLGFLFIFALIFVLAVAGSIINTIWAFLTGGSRPTRAGQQSERPKKKPTGKPDTCADSGDYVFKPGEGEYIDFEEV